MSFKYTPILRKRRNVRFRCERRDAAMRVWVNVDCAAMVSACCREQRPPRYHTGTSDRVAVRTWHNVSSVFFVALGQAELGQEQMAHAGQDQMPPNRDVLADLEVIHAQFRLAILEESLDPPAAKGHQQQNLHGRGLRCVA